MLLVKIGGEYLNLERVEFVTTDTHDGRLWVHVHGTEPTPFAMFPMDDGGKELLAYLETLTVHKIK